MPDSTPLPPSLSQPVSSSSPPRKRRWLLWGCGGLLALLLLVVATIAITIWWMQRPIRPVVLSPQEKQAVEMKLQAINGSRDMRSTTLLPGNSSPIPNVISNRYTPGGKELRLTERELNGLLNQNTELGQTVRLELDSDAINAYVAVPIPKDFPVGGGKMFRARGRFKLSLSKEQAPVAMLEDVTVFGLSLPKEWLGGVKGKNLFQDAIGKTNGAATWQGIKSLRVVPGAIVLEVGE